MQTSTSERQDVEGVIERFAALPEELELLIDNRKLGIKSPERSKWDNCNIEILERGLKRIRSDDRFDFYKGAAEFLISFLFLATEAYVLLKGLEKSSPVFLQVITSNLKIIALAAIPVLVVKEMIRGGDMSLFPVKETEAAPARIIKREIKAIIGIIIFLDLINLFVGA